jgi:HK97 family phage portal protein
MGDLRGDETVSIWDWIGPLNAGSKRRGWDALPAVQPERKMLGTLEDYGAALTVRTLVHGPGATDLMRGQRGNDNNSAVYACLQAIASAIAEPELTVYKIQPGERVEQANTPLGTLLRRPNPHLSMDTLLAYLSNCLHVDGNAYWRKLRSGNELTGNVVELWPISPVRVEPKTTRGTGDFISFYRYHLGPGRYEDIDPANIVHFRTGIDDADHRVGCAPLKRLLREVSSDEQATRYADRLLGNFATPGLSVEWPSDMKDLTQDQAAEVKDRVQAAYSGDNVGAVSVLSPGAKLVSHGFSPEQLDMKTLHRVPEERIAAVLGVPAIVAGLGAGLDHATYSNVAQAREAFTEMKCIPLWRAIGATITMALVPDFTSDQSIVADFDIDDVRALQGDENAKATRLNTLVMGAQITLNEARTEQGLEPLKGGDVLLIPGAWAPTPPAHLAALAAAPPPTAPAAPTGVLPSTRGRLLALPTRSVKSITDLPNQLTALKATHEDAWRTALEAFLAGQVERAARQLRSGGTSADDLIVEAEAALLGEALTPLQTAVLGDVHRLVVAELGIEFGLDDPQTRAYLERAGSNIVGIIEHTRERVAAALIEGQAAGEGIPELARRLRDLPAFGQARAVVVARTELANATTLSAVSSYIASGVVVGCRIHDGDFDAACAAMDGRAFALDQLPPTLGHPQCTRAFAPIVDSAELTRSA